MVDDVDSIWYNHRLGSSGWDDQGWIECVDIISSSSQVDVVDVIASFSGGGVSDANKGRRRGSDADNVVGAADATNVA